ncbi:MAG: TAT-variant-translocated molybdopterin oxidoreductase, partial [Acidobacteriota bacterium]
MKDLESTTHTVLRDAPEKAAEAKRTKTPAAQAAEPPAASHQPKYWRSLDQLAETPGFEEMMHREFPRQAAELGNLDRRRFLQLTGASLGLAGLTACTKQPPEKIIPYVRQPEDIIPGKALYFASAIDNQGYASPILAESHMGRPTKVEGNPEHPASLSGTHAITQAAVFNLYDPDRSQAVRHLAQPRSWDVFLEQVSGLRSALVPLAGEGLAIVTGRVTSPTLVRLLGELMNEMPNLRHYVHEPLAGLESAGFEMATGTRGVLRYDFSKTDVVLSIDGDFLDSGPDSVRQSKDYSKRRRAYDLDAALKMNRFYAVEAVPSSTGTLSDHRLVVKPTEISHFALALAAQLGVAGAVMPEGKDERFMAWVEEVAADLKANPGRSAVVAGEFLRPEVHALILAINESLGNIGESILLTEPVELDGLGLEELVSDIDADRISTMLVMDSNPVYTSPGDLDIAAAMDKVPLRIHLGSYDDETGERCHWHVPLSHSLESWTDLRSVDGTATPVQPLIVPLYDSHTSIEMIAALAGQIGVKPRDLVEATWRRHHRDSGAEGDFTKAWRRCLHDGVIPGTEARAVSPTIDAAAAARTIATWQAPDFELVFRPDPTVLDGRFANNSCLQECPKPITRLTWDNALLLSPATAKAKGLGDLLPGNEQLKHAPLVELKVGERTVTVPVWVVPGLADDTGVLHLGYGRARAGNVGNGTGFDAAPVRTAGLGLWEAQAAVSIEKTGEKYLLACTQDHHSMEGRAPIRETNVETWKQHPDQPVENLLHVDPEKSLMDGKDFPYDSYRWGLSIDLSACSGCNACLVACNVENNIPAVGKDQVSRGREMHWMRIDRYYQGDDPNNVEQIVNQPIPCMQCEQAPCEVVCPVAATVHSDEGLNDMVYNRCVGTRYCSNNCPYKVR